MKQEPRGRDPFPSTSSRPIERRLSRTSLLAQCISPGLVETQFAFKLYDKDPGEAAATYEHIKVGLLLGREKLLSP